MTDIARDDLLRVREWAQRKLSGEQEPPWAWYRHMQLREALDALLAGMDCTTTTENSPQSGRHEEKHLRLVEDTDPQDRSRHHPAGLPTRLPM